jgi:hypothetical protein
VNADLRASSLAYAKLREARFSSQTRLPFSRMEALQLGMYSVDSILAYP